MNKAMLRVSQVIDIAMVSRKTVYNAINSGRLKYQLMFQNNRQVRMFHQDDVLDAFPKANRAALEVQTLQQEVERLKFALSELQKSLRPWSTGTYGNDRGTFHAQNAGEIGTVPG